MSQTLSAATNLSALGFHPLIARWFEDRFGQPTEPQRLGWPPIAAGRNTLIAAPTGSGKTLAAFLWCIDRLCRDACAGELADQTQVVYVSPLKALSNDIRRNLLVPLEEIRALAAATGVDPPAIRAMVRTGDTSTADRQAMLRRPPHILVTTPESLYLLLTSAKARDTLRGTRTVIVDEIHALARDKRGSHLALSLERLAQLCPTPPVRIGLSATQRPIDEIAGFLVGSVADTADADGNFNRTDERADAALPVESDCSVIDVGHLRQLDLRVEVPEGELSAVCSNETWGEIYARLTEMVQSHRSTLIFVNTRRLAERVAHHLAELLGAEAVASHHGSLSRQLRHSAEERLKSGQLRAIVATASLEMGIDVGFIELVCQIGSPRSIATLLQRVGRSGHSLGVVPKGRLFPLTRDELLESLAIVRAVARGRLDRIEIPRAPLDILAQQIVAIAACDEWREDDLFAMVRRAWPYRRLARGDFDAVMSMLGEGVAPTTGRGAYLHRDVLNGRARARRGARLAAITSGGAIPETADYRVVTAEDRTYVGTVNEDFALESQAGDVFLLGSSSWRIRHVRGGEVVVRDAQGAPATVPFWLGEAPARTRELSAEVSNLREELAARVDVGPTRVDANFPEVAREIDVSQAVDWLVRECGAPAWAAEQSARYVAAQKAAVGFVPTATKILFERFFDESGGMQLVIHAPLGARINRAWGLALRKRFCRSFDFELQASADDDGVVLSLGPQHSFPTEALFAMISPQNAEHLLLQAQLAAPMFQTRWRWNATRALAVLRAKGGKRVPPHLQRFRADDLLAAVFPAQVGCLENHSGDVEIPDHPLVRQTVDDCLHEAMDLRGWLQVLEAVRAGHIELVARDTREPSPFSHELLNANPYAFLDGAPLEERRARAVATRRGLAIETLRDLGRLDPEAIAQVVREAQPLVRDEDELHDALLAQMAMTEAEGAPWSSLFARLVAAGRACVVRRPGRRDLWIAAERWFLIKAVFPDAQASPVPALPESLRKEWEASEAIVPLVRGRLQCAGPVTAMALAADLGLPPAKIEAALVALEGEGTALRGSFTPRARSSNAAGDSGVAVPGLHDGHRTSDMLEWCDRRLLTRIHRLTLDGLRRQIQPVEPGDFVRFLLRHQRLLPQLHWQGREGLRESIRQLQGFEMAAGSWEQRVLPARVAQYDPAWLDALTLSGEVTWGRLRPPAAEDEGPSAAGMTRAAPISLVLRGDLPWILPLRPAADESRLRSNARVVRDALASRGALFHHDLLSVTGLLPGHLEEALYELATLGLVTADAFGAVRSLVARHRHGRASRRRRERRGVASVAAGGAPTGRWSLFPGTLARPADEEYLANWARQLLARWGVVFRDLLTRETSAASWSQLLPMLRRMEARGEIRGGRFVAGVGGEQYASAEIVDRVRRVRDDEPSSDVLVVSAADPLNLQGIVTPGARVPATRSNALAIREGAVVATLQGREVRLFDERLSPEAAADVARRLRRTG
jgi:ATP-dependent helicase Lhr and Lhr-like helicase